MWVTFAPLREGLSEAHKLRVKDSRSYLAPLHQRQPKGTPVLGGRPAMSVVEHDVISWTVQRGSAAVYDLVRHLAPLLTIWKLRAKSRFVTRGGTLIISLRTSRCGAPCTGLPTRHSSTSAQPHILPSCVDVV